jgi:hypothetical protein
MVSVWINHNQCFIFIFVFLCGDMKRIMQAPRKRIRFRISHWLKFVIWFIFLFVLTAAAEKWSVRVKLNLVTCTIGDSSEYGGDLCRYRYSTRYRLTKFVLAVHKTLLNLICSCVVDPKLFFVILIRIPFFSWVLDLGPDSTGLCKKFLIRLTMLTVLKAFSWHFTTWKMK